MATETQAMTRKRVAQTISVPQLFRMFPDEATCIEWFEQARWNGRPTCPHCGSQDDISRPVSKPDYYWCKACRKQFNVKTNTPLHATKKPLQEWIYVIYSVLTARKGVSAMQLSKELGCQYRTAWHMLHRIREACSGGEFTLSNVCEVDQTHVDGLEKNEHASKKIKAGRGTMGKAPVVGIRERGGKVSAQPMESVNGRTMREFVESNTAPDATIYRNDSSVYTGISDSTVKHSQGEYVDGDVHTNSIESVWGVIKRSIVGTCHHVSVKHLGRYVNEAVFWLNEGNREVDTLERIRAFSAQIGGKRLSYNDLIADTGLSSGART